MEHIENEFHTDLSIETWDSLRLLVCAHDEIALAIQEQNQNVDEELKHLGQALLSIWLLQASLLRIADLLETPLREEEYISGRQFTAAPRKVK
ncbi:MAG: hypothetical protein ACRD59_03765 [Candidatus Acidiferrales bacterium]